MATYPYTRQNLLDVFSRSIMRDADLTGTLSAHSVVQKAIDASAAGGPIAFIPDGQLKIDAPLDFRDRDDAQLIGFGPRRARLIASGNPASVISAKAVDLANPIRGLRISGFSIEGDCTNAVDIYQIVRSIVDDIVVENGAKDRAFMLDASNYSHFTRLRANGSTSESNQSAVATYEIGDNANSNFYELYASDYGTPANVIIDSPSGRSSVFNLTPQGGIVGLWAKATQTGLVQSLYTENVLCAVRLGSASEGKSANSLIFLTPLLDGATNNDARGAVRALVEVERARQVTLDTPSFSGLNYGSKVTFGGGGTEQAYGVPIINDAGAVVAVEVIRGGTGYGSAPTLTISDGTGFTGTVNMSGGTVASVTVTAGGSGYIPPKGLCAVWLSAATSNRCDGLHIRNPIVPMAGSDLPANADRRGPIWPFILRGGSGTTTQGELTVEGTYHFDADGDIYRPLQCRLVKQAGANYLHDLIHMSGATPVVKKTANPKILTL